MPRTEILHKESNACPSELCHIRKAVAHASHQLGFSQQDSDAIVLAIDEACTNIIRYAYKDCKQGRVVLDVFSDGTQAIFRLRDNAPKSPKDCLEVKKIDLKKPGGLGVMLIQQVMDSVAFVETEASAGNTLEMKKKLPMEKQ